MADDALVLLLLVQGTEDHVPEGLAPPDAAVTSAEAGVLHLDDDAGAVEVVVSDNRVGKLARVMTGSDTQRLTTI